jgi:hypothetical protein
MITGIAAAAEYLGYGKPDSSPTLPTGRDARSIGSIPG